MRTVNGGSWLDISEGCELRCVMHASDAAYLTVGESGAEHELTFDYASFKELVGQAVKALAEMEARAEEEAAEHGPPS